MPAGITSRKLSRLKSIKPSRVMTSCLLAKKRAMNIPTRLPRPNMNPLPRLLLFLFVKAFSFDTGISCTSPFSETRSRGLGDGEGNCRKALPMRRRRADMARVAPVSGGSMQCVGDKIENVYASSWFCPVPTDSVIFPSSLSLRSCHQTTGTKPQQRADIERRL